MEDTTARRTLLGYVLAIALTWILIEVVWGATGGVILGYFFLTHPEYRGRVEAVLKERGIEMPSDAKSARAAFAELPPADRESIMAAVTEMSKEALQHAPWFGLTLFVSAVVFGFAGFLGGLVSRTWIPAAAIPLVSFVLNNPLMRFAAAKELTVFQRACVVVLQFAVCCFLAFLGAKLARRKRQRAKPAVESHSDSGTCPPQV